MRLYLVKNKKINKDGYYQASYQTNYTDNISTFLYKTSKFNFYILLNIHHKYFYVINYDSVNKNEAGYRQIIDTHKNRISYHIRTNYNPYKLYILNINEYVNILFKNTKKNIIMSYRKTPKLKITNYIERKINYNWDIPLNTTATYNDFKILLGILLTKNLNNLIYILNEIATIHEIFNIFISENDNQFLHLTPSYMTQLKTVLKFYNKKNFNIVNTNLDNYDDVKKVKNLIKILSKKRKLKLNITVKGMKFSIINYHNFTSFGKSIKIDAALSYLKSINELDTLYIKLSRALF